LVSECSARLGLNIHRWKSKIHAADANPIMLQGDKLEVDSFLYLGSIVHKQGGTEADICARVAKARVAFNHLSKVWKYTDHKIKNKIGFSTLW
jgi:hypothetical protein